MIKEKIFTLFGTYLQRYDTNQAFDPANQNRGTYQRFNELFALETDNNLITKISGLLINVIPNALIIDVFVPLWERALGLRQAIYNDINIRRKVLRYLPRLNRSRGTLNNYKFLFLQLGFSVDLDIGNTKGGFDSGQLDEGNLDSFFNIQVSYIIRLTCIVSFAITPEIEKQVERIIQYNNPIHCVVSDVVYLNVV